MTDETLQERFIRELLDPRSALSPREVAAREEILELRRQLDALKPQKAQDETDKRKVK
jgi:hypothetical protein